MLLPYVTICSDEHWVFDNGRAPCNSSFLLSMANPPHQVPMHGQALLTACTWSPTSLVHEHPSA